MADLNGRKEKAPWWEKLHIVYYKSKRKGFKAMNTRLIIDGNAVYEIDEDCLACRGRRSGYGQCVGVGGGQRRMAPDSIQKKEHPSTKPPTHK